MKTKKITERKFDRWLRKCVGVSLAFAVALSASLYFSGQTVYASTAYTDAEPNDSYEQAQLITRNAQTPAQYVSNQTSVYRYVTGTLSYDDEDWYKVYLYSDDENYLDLNVGSGTITVELYTSSNSVVPLTTFEFQKYGDTNVYSVPVPESGLYYLRVYHDTTSISSTYYFTIGNPQYTLGSYTHTFRSTTLAAKGTWDDTVDLSEISSIPENAIGYEISIGGCTSSVSSERYFYNKHYGHWVATKSTFSYSLPVSETASSLDQEWGAKIVSTSSSSKTFSPTMTIRYVAPDLPVE
ncbi:MAG: hypothetical protein J1E98_00045 [Lachnospiraceae bacterium]|nr:hypothetical protein [Lachnospiraceae bacterium]